MSSDNNLMDLLASEALRRQKIVEKAVVEALNVPYNDGYAESMRLATADMLADDLIEYSPDFRNSRWGIEPNRTALVAACQVWVDAHRPSTAE